MSIILDIVNNFESLYSISAIQREIELVVSYYRSLGLSDKIVYDSFEITDETRDCRVLFESLEDSLSTTWDIYYDAAKHYFNKHGNIDMSTTFTTDSGLTLGMWLAAQRKIYRGSAAGIYLRQGSQS